MNRLKEFFGQPPDPERDDDFFEVETDQDLFAVSRETALEVERRLDQLPPPRWRDARSSARVGWRTRRIGGRGRTTIDRAAVD
jgi:hypothetical protein